MTAVGEQRGGVLLGRYRCCTVMLKRHLQMPSSAVAWRRRNFGLDFWFSGLHVDNLQMWIRVAAWDFFLDLIFYGAMQSDVGITERSFPLPTRTFRVSGLV